MSDEIVILPPASGLPAWRMPRREEREARATGGGGLVREALAARRGFDHQGFLAALHGLRKSPAIRSAEVMARLAAEAYGVEAIQLVASLAGRWVHVARPSSAERRRIAQALSTKVALPSLDTTALACLLVLRPTESSWRLLAERMSEPPFLVFDLVRIELARRRADLLGTLASAASGGASRSEATRGQERAWLWWQAARNMVWIDECGCGECRGPREGGA